MQRFECVEAKRDLHVVWKTDSQFRQKLMDDSKHRRG